MEELLRRRIGDEVVVVVATDRADGDVHPRRVLRRALIERQLRISPQRWAMLDQVHGTDIVEVDALGAVDQGPTIGIGDVLVTDRACLPLAIWAADCAPVVLVGEAGTIVAFHAGWRGLAAGVVNVALTQLHRRDEQVSVAVLGPVIHACCYEFGEADMKAVAEGAGVSMDGVSGITTAGANALDVPATVAGALAVHGVQLDSTGACTGCSTKQFSHRMGRDRERHAVVAWKEPENVTGPNEETNE